MCIYIYIIYAHICLLARQVSWDFLMLTYILCTAYHFMTQLRIQ